MAPSTPRTHETAGVRTCRLRRQHALTRGSCHPGNEHRPIVHEGAGQPNTWPPGEQQLLLDKHQHRPGRL